jgi:hypothetical protein
VRSLQEAHKPAAAFTMEQLLVSKSYTAGDKDLLRAMLVPGMTYSHDQIATMMNEYKNKEAR